MKRQIIRWIPMLFVLGMLATATGQDTDLDDGLNLGGFDDFDTGGLDDGGLDTGTSDDGEGGTDAAPVDPATLSRLDQADSVSFRQRSADGASIEDLPGRDEFERARQLVSQGDYEAAIEAFSTALKSGNQPMAYYWRGVCQLELGIYTAAIQDLSIALQASGGQGLPEFFYQRGRANQKSGNVEDATDDLEIAVRSDATNPDFQYELGKAWVDSAFQNSGSRLVFQEHMQFALTALDEAIRLDERHAGARYERARAKGQQEFETAIEDLTISLEVESDNVPAMELLGQVHAARANSVGRLPKPDAAKIAQDYRVGIQQYSKAIAERANLSELKLDELTTTNPIEDAHLARANLYINLGSEYLRLGQDGRKYFQSAIDDCKRAVVLAEDIPQYLQRLSKRVTATFTIGQAQRLMNDYRAAEESFTKAMAINNEVGDSRLLRDLPLRRGIALFYQKEYQRALTDFELVQTYQDPRAHFWAGLCHSRMGNLDQAIDAYTRALTLSQSYPLASMNRGLAYLRIGLYEQAIRDFDRVLANDRDNDAVRSYRDLAARQIR